jgi:hypothetical protein
LEKGPGQIRLYATIAGQLGGRNNISHGAFKQVLSNKYIELTACWQFGKGAYTEYAIYGLNEGQVSFWSFTSDGKRSEGHVADGKDVHPEAICFEAQMPAGLARMIYWPGEDGTVHWAVESKVKKGWNRFTEHQYHPAK